jgi:hypothetical protein
VSEAKQLEDSGAQVVDTSEIGDEAVVAGKLGGMPHVQPLTDAPSPKSHRLTIRHLLLLIFATAVLLAIHRSDIELPVSINDQSPLALKLKLIWKIKGIGDLIAIPFQGLAIVAGFGTVARRIDGRSRLSDHPGQWLLVSLGTYVLFVEVLGLMWHRGIVPWFNDPAISPADFSVLLGWMYSLEFVQLSGVVVPLCMAIYFVRQPLRWRIVFVAALVAMLLLVWVKLLEWQGFQFFPSTQWLEIAAWVSMFAATLTMVVAVIRDWMVGSSRDLLHYAGIICALAAAAHALVGPIALRVVPV